MCEDVQKNPDCVSQETHVKHMSVFKTLQSPNQTEKEMRDTEKSNLGSLEIRVSTYISAKLKKLTYM